MYWWWWGDSISTYQLRQQKERQEQLWTSLMLSVFSFFCYVVYFELFRWNFNEEHKAIASVTFILLNSLSFSLFLLLSAHKQ